MGSEPTVGIEPTVQHSGQLSAPLSALTEGTTPTVSSRPTVGFEPTVGLKQRRRTKPIRDVQDALTLAGQVLYKAMYGVPDGTKSKSCTKGYRQLAAETHLDW